MECLSSTSKSNPIISFQVILTALHTKVVLNVLYSYLNLLKLCRYVPQLGSCLYLRSSPWSEEIAARASICMCALVCTSDCS